MQDIARIFSLFPKIWKKPRWKKFWGKKSGEFGDNDNFGCHSNTSL